MKTNAEQTTYSGANNLLIRCLLVLTVLGVHAGGLVVCATATATGRACATTTGCGLLCAGREEGKGRKGKMGRKQENMS